MCSRGLCATGPTAKFSGTIELQVLCHRGRSIAKNGSQSLRLTRSLADVPGPAFYLLGINGWAPRRLNA